MPPAASWPVISGSVKYPFLLFACCAFPISAPHVWAWNGMDPHSPRILVWILRWMTPHMQQTAMKSFITCMRKLSGESMEGSQAGLKMGWGKETGLVSVTTRGWEFQHVECSSMSWTSCKLQTSIWAFLSVLPRCGAEREGGVVSLKAVNTPTSKLKSYSLLQGQVVGRQREKSNRHLCHSLGPQFFQSERKFPLPQSFRSYERLRKRIRRKKESGEFSSFSLNAVRDPFLISHVRTKGLLPKHFPFLSMLTSRFLAALSSSQGIPKGKKW